MQLEEDAEGACGWTMAHSDEYLTQVPFEALQESSDYILVTTANLACDRAPEIVFVNRTLLEMTGYSENEVLGHSPKLFQGKDTDPATRARIRQRLQAGEPVCEAVLNYTKSGSPYWIELNIHPLRNRAGHITHFLSIQRDITNATSARDAKALDERLVKAGEKIGNSGTWAFDLRNDRVIWSDGVYAILKWDHAKPGPSREDCRNIIAPECRALMDRAIERCIKAQEPLHVEVVGRDADGTPLDLAFSGEASVGTDGQTNFVVGAIRNVTGERMVENELANVNNQKRLLENNFAIARKSAKIGVFDYWVKEDLQFWSDELLAMTGLEPDALPAPAGHFIESIDPADRPEFIRLFGRAVAHGEDYEVLIKVRKADGVIMHMLIHAQVVEGEGGRHIVGIARDVTEEIKAANLLKRQEERFRIIADVLSDVLWDYDFETGDVWISPNWPEKLGLGIDEDSFDPQTWADSLLASDRERAKESLRKALGSSADRWVCEYRVVDREKSYKYVEAKAAILRDETGRAKRLLGSLCDLTNEKSHAKSLQRSRTLEAIGKLTGGFAHDFNNILMIVLGNAELLQMSELDEADQTSVKLIENAARSGAALTERLLSFSGKNSLHKTRIDLQQTLDDLALLLKSGLTEKVDLSVEVAPDIWQISVDAEAFKQTVINLAVNARDALPNGGYIWISCENFEATDSAIGANKDLAPGRYVRVSVSDNGIGMDEETIAQAFDPFFTTKDYGKGTGLGLSSVYGFAMQSGGGVQIYSAPGHGTNIQLFLPASHALELPDTDTGAKSPVYDRLQNGDQKRILVVEDQPEVRRHVVSLLTKAGHDVVSAEDAEAALTMLNKGGPFDLMFTDVIMPGAMNGVQLAVEAGKIAPDMKLLFTSGFPAEAFDEIGIADRDSVTVLKKPYSAQSLFEAIEEEFFG